MEDVQSIPSNPSHIQLDQAIEHKPINTRRQESEQRKAEFYKQLEESRSVEPAEEVRRETRQTENVRDNESTHEDDDMRSDDSDVDSISSSDNELDSKLIPKKRFDKELEKRKVLEDELRRERDSRIKFETELSLYNKALESLNEKQHAPQSQPEIDPIDTDAHSFYMNKIRDLESKFENQRNNLSDYEIKQNFANTINHQAAEFTKSHPDFNDAYNHVISVESSKAKMMGYDERQSQEYALQQLQPLAWQTYNRSGNIAETMYNVAKSYGYKAKDSVKSENKNVPNLDKIEKNMKKSYSALDEAPGVSTYATSDTASYTTVDGFTRKLAGRNGRGTNISEFHKALDKVRNSY